MKRIIEFLFGKKSNRASAQPDTQFRRLNIDWNADPVDPDVSIKTDQADLRIEFTLNHNVYKRFTNGQRATLEFQNCSRYRIGKTNVEGWYRGQCRFSGIAPNWGEFYSITGDSKFDQISEDWIHVENGSGSNHFLFYMKDDTFECLADGYQFREIAG